MKYTMTRRIARKPKTCGGWPGGHTILVGDVYLEHKDFPGSDVGYATDAGHPMRMPECARCAKYNGRGNLLGEVLGEQANRDRLV